MSKTWQPLHTLASTEPDNDNREFTGPVPPESVYRSLREEIIIGSLKPGRKLRVRSVCDRYNTGITPVRDALTRLSAEGLVSEFDQRGFLIAEISNDELRELVTTRCWLEEIALARSIVNRDKEWEERLVLAFERLSRVHHSTSATEYRINPDWEARHRAFHKSLIANCDSRLLLGYCHDLRDRCDRYRHIAAGVYSYPIEMVEGQHRELMDCAIEGRTEDAVRTLREHYHITWTIVEKAIIARSHDIS